MSLPYDSPSEDDVDKKNIKNEHEAIRSSSESNANDIDQNAENNDQGEKDLARDLPGQGIGNLVKSSRSVSAFFRCTGGCSGRKETSCGRGIGI